MIVIIPKSSVREIYEKARLDKDDKINNCMKIAVDLWSRDIKKISDSCVQYHNWIDKKVGLEYTEFIDNVLKENWSNWMEEMIGDMK